MFVVHGAYFNNNFGDTLLIKLMCDYIASIVGRDRVYLAIPGNKSEQETIGYPVISKDKYKFVTHLIFSGGGYFGEPPRKGLRLIKWYMTNYKRHVAWNGKFKNAKVGAFGVGYGPLSLPVFRKILTKPLRRAEVVFFRDQESIDYFKLYNKLDKEVFLATDFALSLERSNKKASEKIALHLPKMDFGQIGDVLSAVDKSRFSGNEIEFISDGDGDGGFSKKYMEEIKNIKLMKKIKSEINFINYENMNELIDRLASYSFVITTKLHVGIVTTALGGKVISIPWHTKTSRFYKQIGLGQFCIQKEDGISGINPLLNCLDNYKADEKVITESLAKMKTAINDFVVS